MLKSKKNLNLSLTQVRKTLNQCQFNPRMPGPAMLMSEVDSPEYYEMAAIQLIKEATNLRRDLMIKMLSNSKALSLNEIEEYDNKIRKAIQHLVLATLKI